MRGGGRSRVVAPARIDANHHVSTDSMELERKARWSLAIVAAVTATAIGAHFAMTFLYVAPMNHVRLRVGAVVHAYMLPFFEQNWNLFAPNPISDDRGLLVRAQVGRAGLGGRITPFSDLTTPAIRAVQRNRLLPSRLARLPSGALQNLYWSDPVADRLRQRRVPGRGPRSAHQAQQGGVAVPRQTTDERATHRLARELIARLGSAAAVARWGRGVTRIQVRIVRHVFPPFSERHDRGLGRVYYQDLPWTDVARVAT